MPMGCNWNVKAHSSLSFERVGESVGLLIWHKVESRAGSSIIRKWGNIFQLWDEI